MKIKNLISAILTFVLLVGSSVNAYASEAKVVDEKAVLAEGNYKDDELQEIAEILGYEMITEDGYVLENISVTFSPSADIEEPVWGKKAMQRAIGDSIGDVRKVSSDIYFPDNPIASNWYQGPLSAMSKTYSRSVSAVYSCTTSVSVDVLNAGLSFSITDSTTETTTLTRPAIPATQMINVKEYGVYDKYSFTVYNIWGKQKGTGYAYKPMGLYVTQAIYSK